MSHGQVAKLGLFFLCTSMLVAAATPPVQSLGNARDGVSPIIRPVEIDETERDESSSINYGSSFSIEPADGPPSEGTPCQHRVDLYDTYGDGWTGNTLDVLVNGAVVLNHITLSTGTGPLAFYFMAATGDTIHTVYHATGMYPYENYYRIYDGNNGLIVQDGVPGQQQPYGVTVSGNCEPPQTGPCCHDNGECEMVAGPEQCADGQFLGFGHTCAECVCTVECPPGSLEEPEPCGQDLDGGCNSPLQPFVQIQDGDTFCGSTWSTANLRDTDWYRVYTTESCTMTWTVESENPVTAFIFQPYPNWCNGPWTLAEGTAEACQPLSITSDCRPAGEYWLWIGTPDDHQAYPCGNYAATLTCTPCYIAQGACCFPNGHCTFVTYQNCYIAGGHWQGENVPCDVCSPYYCDVSSVWCQTDDEYIARVQIGTIDNATDCTQYGDYTALSTDVVYGTSTTLIVTNGSYLWPNDRCAAWIDYNHDFEFAPNESLGVIAGVGPYVFTANPPWPIEPGPTRLRIVLMPSDPDPSPCGTFPYGEAEDYTVILREVEGACCDAAAHTCLLQLPSACEGTYGGPFTGCAGDDCNQNGMDDFCDIFSGTSADCDDNGIPDECQPFVDCNGNGVADFCDIAGGASRDCDGNGIPDECDIANCPPGDLDCSDCNANGVLDGCEVAQHGHYIHQWDDGTHEEAMGLSRGGYIAWLNHFVNTTDDTRIRSILLAYGAVPDGTPVTVYVWSDPDQDGDPHDARVLTSVATVTANAELDVFNRVSIPPTFIGPAGRHFFVGAVIHHGDGSFPAPLDQTSSAGQSWLAGDRVSLDPDDLAAADIALKLVDHYAYPGNWLVRAEMGDTDCNHNSVPDECDIAAGVSRDNNENGVPDECECPGDLDGDWDVDLSDLAELLSNYGTTAGAAYDDGDLDGDGDVDISDLAALLGVYGDVCPH